MIITLYVVKAAAISRLDLDMYFDGGTYTTELRDANLYATEAEAAAAAEKLDALENYAHWEAAAAICNATAHKEA